nr:uncharacterized protein LOC129458562 isoform X2 [Symphalangus syndactylus]
MSSQPTVRQAETEGPGARGVCEVQAEGTWENSPQKNALQPGRLQRSGRKSSRTYFRPASGGEGRPPQLAPPTAWSRDHHPRRRASVLLRPPSAVPEDRSDSTRLTACTVTKKTVPPPGAEICVIVGKQRKANKGTVNGITWLEYGSNYKACSALERRKGYISFSVRAPGKGFDQLGLVAS